MSTSLALLELTEEITTALDHNKCTIGVFIDLKKVFDTIDHDILLTTLNHYLCCVELFAKIATRNRKGQRIESETIALYPVGGDTSTVDCALDDLHLFSINL